MKDDFLDHIENTYLVDVRAIQYRLSLTPEERIEAHEKALSLMLELQAAGEKYFETANQLKAIRDLNRKK